jgi:hypothetical protein
MNDPMTPSIWEGPIEVLHDGERVLTASARLWRRDNAFGTDWGGQLRIPVAQRRSLPAGEYRVVLEPGNEASAFIGFGASDAASTFPTLTGHGTPPFGGAPTEADPSTVEAFRGFPNSEGIAGVEGVEAVAEALAAAPARELVAATAAVAPAAPASIQPSPVAANERQDPHMTEPTTAAAAPTSPEAAPQPAVAAPPPAPVPLDPAIEQTETLARAFLSAVEVRQQLQSMRGQGLEANVLASLRAIVDEVTGHIESRLRSSQQPTAISARIESHLVVLAWARVVIADVPGRGDFADLAKMLARLVEALDPAARTRAAGQERPAA